MSSPVLLDLLIIAALLLAIWLGYRKGLVLSLCSLLAVVIALVGSHFIADSLAPRLAEVLEPRLAVSIQEILDRKTDELAGLQLDGAISALEEKGGVYQWASEVLDEALSSGLTQTTAHAAAAAASAIAVRFAHSIILLVSFLVLLIIWGIVSRALDLVARLPVLSSLNQLGGGAFGLIKGLILVWLVTMTACDLLGLISPDTVSRTHLLRVFEQYSPLHIMIV